MQTLAGLAPADLLNNIIGVFNKPLVKLDGSINLVKAAVISCTFSAAISIYANYRQLAHMASPAYRAPINWNDENSKTEQPRPNGRISHLRHVLRHGMIHTSVHWLVSCGMLLGGMDRLWTISSGVAGRLTRSADSFPGRLTSTSVFTLGYFVLNWLTSSIVRKVYERSTSGSIADSNARERDLVLQTFPKIWYMRNKEKREKTLQWPRWKQNVVFATIMSCIVGLPCVALTALYESLGPSRLEPMAISVGVVGFSVIALVNGPILWKYIKNSDTCSRTATKDPRKGSTWLALAEWSEKKELSFDPVDFETKVRAMIKEQGTIEMVVRPDNWDKNDKELPEEWMATEEHSVFYLPDRLLVCFKEHQLESRDMDFNLALVARALVTYDYRRSFYFGQGLGLMSMSLYAILHHYYAKSPALLLDAFPSLPATSTNHIPLAVSATMTTYLTEWTGMLWRLERYSECQAQLRDDRRVIEALPEEHAEGWKEVVREQARATLKGLGGKDICLDVGTRDGLYAFVTGAALSETERIVALDNRS